ncbi:MAG: phosphotransferase [Chloroflexi bacterium]|nr:phosphotransferase [Chloroflexota bacterium]MDA1240755.1 phosphotransferase [Chloroflexota bacterium]
MPDETLLPSNTTELTARWLTATLTESGVLDSRSRIFATSIEPLEARAGVNGLTYRLRLKYSGEAGPPTIVAKLPAASPAARGVAAFQRWYEREVRFYTELAADSPLRVPEPYFGAVEGDRAVLLLEDLGRLRQVDQIAGCTISEAEAAVDGAASMHARWWEDEGLDERGWLPLTTVHVEHARPVQGAFRRGWEAVRGRIDSAAHAAIDRAVESYPALLERIGSGPRTLLHGDYRLDNLFFDGSEGQPGVFAFDWQFACRGRGAYDVAYFLGLDLEPALRKQHEQRLLLRYMERLIEGGVRGYTIDECKRDYATSLLLSFAVFAIGAAGAQASERMRLVHEVGLARLAAAIIDQDPALLGG